MAQVLFEHVEQMGAILGEVSRQTHNVVRYSDTLEIQFSKTSNKYINQSFLFISKTETIWSCEYALF